MDDHFRPLGLVPQASPREVKRAYRRIARLIHPDRDPAFTKRFVALKNSYELITAGRGSVEKSRPTGRTLHVPLVRSIVGGRSPVAIPVGVRFDWGLRPCSCESGARVFSKLGIRQRCMVCQGTGYVRSPDVEREIIREKVVVIPQETEDGQPLSINGVDFSVMVYTGDREGLDYLSDLCRGETHTRGLWGRVEVPPLASGDTFVIPNAGFFDGFRRGNHIISIR